MNDNNNKNTLLLLVIAIATLLVAIVGATFAYFTAQTSAEASANIRVETSTSDSFGYGTFKPLTILATQQNFGPNMGSLKASTSGTVSLTANREDSATYCYTATVKIIDNPFVYTTAETKPDSLEAELLLEIAKNGSTYTQSIDGLTFKTITEQRVCDQTNDINNPTCEDSQTINGYDITTFGSTANTEELQQVLKEIKIPAEDGEFGEEGLPYVHRITATAGQAKSDNWGITGTFVNLTDTDQQKNTNKTFNATLEFKTVSCENGEPIPAE